MREIILDTETTGLNPKDGHRIVEIGCIEIINKVKTENFFHCFVNPQRDMPVEAYNIHGISEEFLQDKPLFNEVAGEFLSFIKDANLVIHNASFDLKFLNHHLTSVKLPSIKNQVVDTLLLARKKFPGSPATLDALCKRFNVSLSQRTKHGALVDCELLAQVYIELVRGEQNSLFKKEKPLNAIISPLSYKEPRIFTLSEEEQHAHEEFIKTIANNLWEKA
jgi:DNA polymerase-3 subunit epsilon